MSNFSENNNLDNEALDTARRPGPCCPYPCRCLCECVNEVVELYNSRCVLDTYVYKNGYQPFEACGMRGFTVGYGITVKYVDSKGCRRTTNQEGSVIFCNVPPNFGDDIDVHICNPVRTKECPNAISVEFACVICERKKPHHR